jgi:AraC-like DNA-binding protein
VANKYLTNTVGAEMADFETELLLATDVMTVWDVSCPGTHRSLSAEESAGSTHFVFPYRGLYVHHVGRNEAVAESSQLVFINEDEPFRVSHPCAGGDSSLSIRLSAPTLLELVPAELLQVHGRPAVNRLGLRLEAATQACAATLRHRLDDGTVDALEAEALTLALIGRALGQRTTEHSSTTAKGRTLVDRAKVVIAADLARRRSLAEVAAEVGVSPVYLTQIFQRIEGIPLYRYQLQLRLARALQLLGECDSVTDLALALGFSSHSHFSAAFKQAYGQTPTAFRISSRLR